MDDWDGVPQPEEVVVDGELILSASSVATYLRCPKQWEFAYIHKERRPPTIKQALGIASHDAYDFDMTAKLATGENLPMALVLDAFSDGYDTMWREGFSKVKEEDEKPGEAKDQQVRVIRKYRKDLAPLIEPIMVEQDFMIEVDGQLYSGTLDLASVDRTLVDPDTMRETIKVRDWKNTAQKPSDTSRYVFGMIGYALGFRALTGTMEDEVQLDYLVRYKAKEPGYFPVSSGGPVSARSVEGFSNTLLEVRDSITKGSFFPAGLQNGACSWCGFKSICPAYAAAKLDYH